MNDPTTFDYNVMRARAAQIEYRFPKWDRDDIVSELWLLVHKYESDGTYECPIRAAHNFAPTALWDTYCQQWMFGSRNSVRRNGITEIKSIDRSPATRNEVATIVGLDNPDFYYGDREVFRRRVASLTTKQWEAVYHHVHGRSQAKTAAVLGCNPTNVEWHWKKAKQVLAGESK